MAYIQTKPKEAGTPIEAIQFLGDPAIHPMIKWSDEANKPIDSDRWCLKIPGHYEQVLRIGDWILHPSSKEPQVLYKGDFDRSWRLAE